MAKKIEDDFFRAGMRALSTVTVLGLSIVALIMLYPIWDVIVFAAIFAFIFKPLEVRLERFIGSFFAALVPTLGILFLIILPVMMVIQLLYANLNAFAVFVESDIVTQTLSTFAAYVPEEVIQVSFFSLLQNWIGGVFVSVPTILIKVFVMMVLTYYLLREGETMFEYIFDVLPQQQVDFVKAFIGLGKGNLEAVIYGHFFTSLIISIVTILVAYLLGAPHIQTLSVLILLFAVAPIIGAWVVLIPLSLYYFGLGNSMLAGAYFVLAMFIAVLDDFIRPKLVSRTSNVHMAVVLVGFISGAMIFGVMGIFLGPLILTFLKTALDAYKIAMKPETA